MMESGVKTISKPVIDRLPVNVEQLDEFACRQLDRVSNVPLRHAYGVLRIRVRFHGLRIGPQHVWIPLAGYNSFEALEMLSIRGF